MFNWNQVDCIWDSWGVWGECSESCGDGIKTKTRSKTVSQAYGGTCNGTNKIEEICNEGDCQST